MHKTRISIFQIPFLVVPSLSEHYLGTDPTIINYTHMYTTVGTHLTSAGLKVESLGECVVQ